MIPLTVDAPEEIAEWLAGIAAEEIIAASWWGLRERREVHC